MFRRGVDHERRLVDRRNKRAQFLDRKVERVSNRARDVFGHRRFDSKVTVGKAAHFVEQSQNCLLVAFILLRLLARKFFELAGVRFGVWCRG